jgi:hypothetical protein
MKTRTPLIARIPQVLIALGLALAAGCAAAGTSISVSVGGNYGEHRHHDHWRGDYSYRYVSSNWGGAPQWPVRHAHPHYGGYRPIVAPAIIQAVPVVVPMPPAVYVTRLPVLVHSSPVPATPDLAQYCRSNVTRVCTGDLCIHCN